MHKNEMFQAQTDAVLEIASDIVEAIVNRLAAHGKDPDNLAIIAAGYAYSIDLFNQVRPEFRDLVISVITNKEMNRLAEETLKQSYEQYLKEKDQNS